MEFDTTRPIYRQIIDDFKKQMIRGELKNGDKILSQREYAARAQINPNTVQRAYREMENMNLVLTMRGQGTFINVNEDRLRELKREMAQGLVDRFIKEMHSLEFNQKEVLKMLKEKYPDEEGQNDRV
jgi:GntR family transcriptional regulator